MVLFSSILARMDVSGDSKFDQDALGYLLLCFVIPGYCTMAWQFVQSWLDLATDVTIETKSMIQVGSLRQNPHMCGL